LQLIGGKWKLVILFNLQNGPKRFGELKRDLSPITQQMLIKELRDLEKNKLVLNLF
jgi:DNA-binding HxlR family transcriptional regulator